MLSFLLDILAHRPHVRMKVTTDLLFDLAANDVELRGCFFLLVINSIDVKISQN